MQFATDAKGRVENGVGYVKKNFLAGLQLPPHLDALNIAARQWMDTVANVRTHGETHRVPLELFAVEKPHLTPLAPLPADTGVIRTVRATNRFRVVLDTNRYSVPSLYASQRLLLKCYADRLCVYHGEKLIATHTRSYDRRQDFENPEHVKELLNQRRAAREAKLLLSFYALSPRGEEYYRQLQERRLNPRQQGVFPAGCHGVKGFQEKVVREVTWWSEGPLFGRSRTWRSCAKIAPTVHPS